MTVCVWDVDGEYSEEDEKERRQLIEQVFELQNTLDGLVTYLLTYFAWVTPAVNIMNYKMCCC